MLNTQPKVVATSPQNQETEVVLNSAITITFNTDMQSSTLTSANIIVVRDDTKEQMTIDTVSYASRIWTVTLADILPNDTRIVVTISEDVEDLIGRDLVVPYVFSFETASESELGTPVVVEPSHGSVVTAWPTIAVIVDGAVSYEYQVSKNPTMIPLETGPSYDANTTYYWRGRGIDSEGNVSAWSEIAQFWFGSTSYPTSESAEFMPQERLFAIYDITPEPEFNISSTSFAEIGVEFTTQPDPSLVTTTNFILRRTHITGMVAGTDHSDDLSYTVSIDPLNSYRVLLTVSSSLSDNTEIELKIRRLVADVDGNILGQDQKIRWSTRLSPLYVTPQALRAMTGSLFEDMHMCIHKPDEYFYRHIVAQSAKANYLSIMEDSSTSTPTVSDVYDWDGDLTYTFLRWAQLSSLLSVLDALYLELIPLTGVNERLGDLSVSHSINLEMLRDFMDRLSEEIADIESSTFTSSSAYGIKGAYYIPEYTGDYSFTPKPNIGRVHEYPLSGR